MVILRKGVPYVILSPNFGSILYTNMNTKKDFKMKKLIVALICILPIELLAFEALPSVEKPTAEQTTAEQPTVEQSSLEQPIEEQSIEEQPYLIDNTWAFSVAINQTNFDNRVTYFGIDDSAFGMSFDIDYISNNWITTLSTEYLSYDDNAEFSQTVVGQGFINNGDLSDESSDASGLLVGIAIGKLFFFGESNDITVIGQVGINAMLYSERSIAFCDNCYSEDIDIDGGAFIKAGVVKDINQFSFGLHTKFYLSGDQLNSTFGISVGSTY